MQNFDWKTFEATNLEALSTARKQVHRAIQGVAAVGRRFLPHSPGDENATLTWIPGLMRLAGKWISGRPTFRVSFSINDFTIYIVDKKVNNIAQFPLRDHTHLQIMVWLEEQIRKFGLDTSDFALHLPYDLPEDLPKDTAPFDVLDPEAATELSNYFHNAYILLREIKKRYKIQSEINIWPHHLDESITYLIKSTGDPETDSTLTIGVSPGDTDHMNEPYFYVSSWPFVDVNSFSQQGGPGIWIESDWTGAVLPARDLWKEDQKEGALDFFFQSIDRLAGILKD